VISYGHALYICCWTVDYVIGPGKFKTYIYIVVLLLKSKFLSIVLVILGVFGA